MSATYSSGTITQTDTDTDPTVFSGLDGVTITGNSEYKVVLFDGVKLIVNGTLTIPKYYRLYFINTSTVDFKINGTVNVDYFTTTGTGTVYHTTPWVEFGRESKNSAGQQCLQVSGSGTLNWRGGSILADPVVLLQSGADVLFNNSVIDSTNSNMFRIFTSNLTFEGSLINIGKRTTINASGITLDNYSPKGGNGLDHGAVNTGFTLNNFSPEANSRDSALRFNNSDSIFNASTGMNLAVLPFDATGTHPHNGGGCRLYRKVSTNIKDMSNNPLQDVKTFLPSYDDNNRVNLSSNFGSVWDFTSVSNTILTTAANGKSSTHNQILKVWYLLTTDGNDLEVIRFDKDADDGGIFTASSYKYNYLIQSNNYNLNGLEDLELGIFLLPDANITESNKATVDAYTEIDTPQKFYDRASSYLYDNYEGEADTLVSRDGNTIDAGDYDLVIDSNASSAFVRDGTTITIKASTFVGNLTTTGVITLTGSNVQGRYTDANGTNIVLEYAVSNIEAGSTLQIYNVTKSQEVINQVISATSTSGNYTTSQIETGDNVRIRLTCQAGESAFLPYEAFGVATSAGISFIADQQADTVYNDNGIDGSDLGTLTADYPNVQIDISDGDGVADSRELYAFAVYQSTTSTGIENWFGAITAINAMNYRINVSNADIKLQNTGSNPLVISGARIFRSDGTSVLHADAGDKPMTQDTGELLQYIKPQVDLAINENTKLDGVSKNTKIIPALL